MEGEPREEYCCENRRGANEEILHEGRVAQRTDGGPGAGGGAVPPWGRIR
jgi:hypothetical protein